MRKRAACIGLVLGVVILGSCSIGLFGPNKNKIMQWLPDYEETTKFQYKQVITSSSSEVSFDDYSYTVEIVDIEKRDTKTNWTVKYDDTDAYFIADDVRERLVFSSNDTVDDNDLVFLETPVEVGTRWTGRFDMYIFYRLFPSFSPVDDTTFSIDAVDATREAGAETANDVVVIDVDFPSDTFAGSFSLAEMYFSPTYGWLGERYEYTESGTDYSMETVTTDIDKP